MAFHWGFHTFPGTRKEKRANSTRQDGIGQFLIIISYRNELQQMNVLFLHPANVVLVTENCDGACIFSIPTSTILTLLCKTRV